MSTDPPRRRIRRTPRTRQIPPSAAAPRAVPIEVDDATVPALPAAPAPAPAPEPNEVIPDAAAPEHPVPPISDVLPDPERTWLPAGLALLVMVGLLVCAGLVLIAAGQ